MKLKKLLLSVEGKILSYRQIYGISNSCTVEKKESDKHFNRWNKGTYWNFKKMGQLVCFLLTQTVSCISNKYYRHQKLTLRIKQFLKGFSGSRNWGPSSYQYSINIKQNAKGRLYTQLKWKTETRERKILLATRNHVA